MGLGSSEPRRSFGAVRTSVVLGMLLLALALAAGCEPTQTPGSGTPGPSGSGTVIDGASGPPPGTSIVTLDGTTVTIVGTGNGTTDEFDLPAGTAAMTVSTCPSNQVIPFVTIYDEQNNKLGLIVDAIYTVRNLVGGRYYLTISANPTCVWTIVLTPS